MHGSGVVSITGDEARRKEGRKVDAVVVNACDTFIQIAIADKSKYPNDKAVLPIPRILR